MTARRIFVALLTCLAAFDILILGIRVFDIVTLGRLVPFSAEGPVLYAIWRIRNGYRLYEWPTRPYFTLTLYNFLFYESYAAFFRFRVLNDAIHRRTPDHAAFVRRGRRNATPRVSAPRKLPRACPASLVTWIGCMLPGWWRFDRPDVPAAAIAA
jgi:hypothetical protein